MSGLDACSSAALYEVTGTGVPQELLMTIAPAAAARCIMSASCASLARITPSGAPTLKLMIVAL
jgi:hypothetical protein